MQIPNYRRIIRFNLFKYFETVNFYGSDND